MKQRVLVMIASAAIGAVVVGQVGDAWARAGSGGSRGSRSYSAPAKPSSPASPTTPTSPSRSFNQPTTPAAGMQRPSFMQRFGGAIAGFAIGGLLGGLLFGGLGGLGGGFGGGIGMFDILLIAGGIFVLFYFLRRRRESEQPAHATAGASSYATATANTGAGGAAVLEMPAASAESRELEQGLAHVRQMDPGFDPVALADWARVQFANVQTAVASRDVGLVRDRLAPEMYGVLLTQCEDLKGARRKNLIEKIDLRRADVTEVWQEKGQDYVTVYLEGAMLDYTVDEATGAVVHGSKTEPTRVEEYWTFTRPVGPNPWKLSAIQTA